ncbi:MAG: hypothetical protein QOF02_3338 [Blastocatellia bacterium]|jgi:hypothetical protein|nr:hypothetical protein [Blastocatellia bacterium]
MNRMEQRALWLARHREQSSPAASQPDTSRAEHNAAALHQEPLAHETHASERASVNLHIEELVLHGFAPHDRYRIGDAVQHELARLLSTRGAPSALRAGGEHARLSAGSFNVTSGAEAKKVGQGVARAVFGELKR